MDIVIGYGVDIVKRRCGYSLESVWISLGVDVDILKTAWMSLGDGLDIDRRRYGCRLKTVWISLRQCVIIKETLWISLGEGTWIS